MKHLRKRIERLEKSPLRNRSPEVLVVERDPVTGRWVGSTDTGADPARCLVLMFSDAHPDTELISDAPPRVIDLAAQ